MHIFKCGEVVLTLAATSRAERGIFTHTVVRTQGLMSLLATRGMCSSIIAAQCSSSRVSKANEDMLLYLMTMQFYHLIYGRKASLTRFRRRKTITFTCLFGAISKKGLFLTMERLVLCVLTFLGGRVVVQLCLLTYCVHQFEHHPPSFLPD